MVTEVYAARGEVVEPDSRGRVSGVRSCRLRGQGQYEDVESGLLYTRHRYYNPGAEQFVSADPLGIGPGENTYRLGPNLLGVGGSAGVVV